VQQGLPGFAEAESPISVDVIWMHLNFDGFSDETIHVAGFRREELSVLYSETSDFKPQTPGKYPKGNILHKEHGESLKSGNRIAY
jgi:hypothetical protein